MASQKAKKSHDISATELPRFSEAHMRILATEFHEIFQLDSRKTKFTAPKEMEGVPIRRISEHDSY